MSFQVAKDPSMFFCVVYTYMAGCYFNDHMHSHVFSLSIKKAHKVFEISLPPDDSPWMKQAVAVSF